MFGLALLALAYGFCRYVYGARCAIFAVIVIATTPLYIMNSRTVIFDIALAFFVSAAIFAGYLAEEYEGRARRNWYLAGALAAGCATLVKGPVGFLLPVIVLLIFHRIAGRRGVWKQLFAPLNLLAFFGVTLPWFIGLSLQHRDFPYYGLIVESFLRFTTTKLNRGQPVYFYAVIVMGLFAPWSFILPEACVAAWRNKWFKFRADRFCLVWAVVVVIFFSLSKSKLPGYILTASTVACGILMARFFEQAMMNPGGKAARIVGRMATGLAIACGLGATAVIFFSHRITSLAQPLAFSAVETGDLGRHFIPTSILLLVLAALGFLARIRRSAGLCLVCLALFPLALFTPNFDALQMLFDAKSARQLAQKIPALPSETEVACFGFFPVGLPFYMGHPVTLISADGGELTSNYIVYHLKNEQAWPATVVDSTHFEQWISQRNHAIYLLAREDGRPQLEAIAGVQKTDIQTLTPGYIGVLLQGTAPWGPPARWRAP